MRNSNVPFLLSCPECSWIISQVKRSGDYGSFLKHLMFSQKCFLLTLPCAHLWVRLSFLPWSQVFEQRHLLGCIQSTRNQTKVREQYCFCLDFPLLLGENRTLYLHPTSSADIAWISALDRRPNLILATLQVFDERQEFPVSLVSCLVQLSQ